MQASDNSSSSISTSTTQSSSRSSSANLASASSSASPPSKTTAALKHNDLIHRSSSASSSGDCRGKPTSSILITPERAQRRKLMQMISHYDQHNKLLQRELAKEKRRRTEELACVVKSLLCFEAKLKTDMKNVNQRLQHKDDEICRLVRQNRALRKSVQQLHLQTQQKCAEDEGVVEDAAIDELEAEELEIAAVQLRRHADKPHEGEDFSTLEATDYVDCLELEALQCQNCRKQFYDIELKESWSQTSLKMAKDGARNMGKKVFCKFVIIRKVLIFTFWF